ncbi:MAG: alpha/beta fold hydrolase [Ktedonobacterales bacterium]
MSEPLGIVERGIIAGGVRLATAMNDAPRSFYARSPLIVLPGIGFVWRDYLSLLEHYGGERRVFALDWPGFGGSALPNSNDHHDYGHVDQHLVQTLSTWVDSLGIGRAVLLGTGISGMLAVRYASAHPKRTLGVAVISPIGLLPDGTDSSIVAHLLRAPWLMRRLDGYVTPLLIGPGSTAEARRVLERHRQLRRDAGHRNAIQAYAPLWRSIQQSQPEISMLAKALSVPAMVLRGALDPLVTEREARQAAKALGGHGTLAITLPESGHLPFLQQSARFYQALSGLLETAEIVALETS